MHVLLNEREQPVDRLRFSRTDVPLLPWGPLLGAKRGLIALSPVEHHASSVTVIR